MFKQLSVTAAKQAGRTFSTTSQVVIFCLQHMQARKKICPVNYILSMIRFLILIR